jgi:hypothetical protein
VCVIEGAAAIGLQMGRVWSHTVALPFYIKKYLLRRQKKEELWKLNYISPCQNIPNLPKKNPLKQTKILQDIITL